MERKFSKRKVPWKGTQSFMRYETTMTEVIDYCNWPHTTQRGMDQVAMLNRKLV